ncbi:hypothetical protein V1509DRAFT_636005 [Lipomyces kononenkoae]
MISTIPGIFGVVYSFLWPQWSTTGSDENGSFFVAAVFNMISAVIMAISPNLACFKAGRVMITIFV